MEEVRYFNFPIQLLDSFLDDHMKVLHNIWDYALYAQTLNYEFGDEEEMIRSAMKFFSVSGGKAKTEIYRSGKVLYDKYAYNSPKASITKDQYFDYYKNDKTLYQKACLLGFIAIKSILGKKSYCKIDNKYWLSRMDGKVRSVANYSELSEPIRKYANEYWCKKIKHELRDNWYLITYAHYTRGFYISFDMSLEDLIYQAEKRRKSNKQKIAKQKEKEALEKALKRLYDE